MHNFTFKNTEQLANQLQKDKGVLLIIPAISVGKPGLNTQYKDYLDWAAKIYKDLTKDDFGVDIFVLGAEHRWDGFLHEIGLNYLIKNYHIPNDAFAWVDANFKKVGLCSVEETELTAQFLKECNTNYQIITSISESQLERYILHQKGYKINSLYFVFPDNVSYYHIQNKNQERLLIDITKKDPRWESVTGLELRNLAHLLRDPNKQQITDQEIERALERIKKIARN